MNAKLKKLEALEKLVPPEGCTHPSVVVQRYGDAESEEQVHLLQEERESCARCRRKILVVLLRFAP